MKVFFDQRMSVDSGGYSPSGSKPGLCVADWQQRNLDIEICGFDPVTESELCLAHSPDYVRGVLSGQIQNGHGNRIPAVTASTLWTCGSMIAASRAALIDRVACAPSSGFHHAGYEFGEGFCTFNASVVVGVKLVNEGAVEKIGILDLDQHWSNGTDDIINVRQLHRTILNWSYGGYFSERRFSQKELLQQIRFNVETMKDAGAGLVIYGAGADPHKNDPLGGAMTSSQMRERDALVFRLCKKIGLPIAWALYGGYQRDAAGTIAPVLKLHRATMIEAIAAYRR